MNILINEGAMESIFEGLYLFTIGLLMFVFKKPMSEIMSNFNQKLFRTGKHFKTSTYYIGYLLGGILAMSSGIYAVIRLTLF